MESIGSSIANILSGGTSIDTGALVTQLVAASREPREAVLTERQTLNSTRISSLASASASLSTFAEALTETLKDVAFAGQPASNDPTIVSLSALSGGIPKGLPAQIEVIQLASAQTLESVNLPAHTDPVGLGTLTLTTASGPHTITIDATNNSLDGLAAAINDADTGVTATVVTDNRGARLILKGETGDVNAFTLTKEASDTADVDLERFTFDGATGGMTRTKTAVDSIVKIDGVEHQNDSNELEDAIPFVRIDLNKAAPGTLVTLASTQPTSTIKDLVKEFVSAYNQLRSALNAATAGGSGVATAGALSGDSSVRDMMTQLSRLTTTNMTDTGNYRTLSNIGVSTTTTGTLILDEARLDNAIETDPEAVTQMLNPVVSTATNPGLAKIVTDVKDRLEAEGGSLASAKAKYAKLGEELTAQLEKLDEEMVDYEERLSAVYSAMGSKLAALKATQSYLDQQISLWTNESDN